MRPGPSPFARPDCHSQPASKCPRGTNPGRTYRFFNGDAVVPFGWGLSYTNWSYAVEQPPTTVSLEPLAALINETTAADYLFPQVQRQTQVENSSGWPAQATFHVKVTNTGSRDADDVVLGFLVPPGAGKQGVPLQMLFDFQRVHVKAGQTATVACRPALTDFAQAQLDGSLRATPGDYTVKFGLKGTQPHGMGFAEVPSLRATLTNLAQAVGE